MMRGIKEIFITGYPDSIRKTETFTNTTDTAIICHSTGILRPIDIHIDIDEKYRVLNNSLIESFGIHYRALIDFFYLSPKEDDDIMAEHFFKDLDNWKSKRPTINRKEKIERVNKEIVHITNTLGKAKMEWPFTNLLDEIERLIVLFNKSIPNKLLGDRWR